MPAKVNGGNLKGTWPAVWMLGNGNGAGWPSKGEIDIVEAVNGNPKIYMTTHSTNHFGGNGQHPGSATITVNADFTKGMCLLFSRTFFMPEPGRR